MLNPHASITDKASGSFGAVAHKNKTQLSAARTDDGSNAARTDITFNPACDPNSLHTSDGQHTAFYCNGCSDGYVTTWNNLHPNNIQIIYVSISLCNNSNIS